MNVIQGTVYHYGFTVASDKKMPPKQYHDVDLYVINCQHIPNRLSY